MSDSVFKGEDRNNSGSHLSIALDPTGDLLVGILRDPRAGEKHSDNPDYIVVEMVRLSSDQAKEMAEAIRRGLADR
jgi:hypothetical protein